MRLKSVWGAVTFAAVVAIGACGGGGSSPTTPTPTPPPPTGGGGGGGGGSGTPPTTTITIDTNGAVSPQSITVPPGTRVTFVNNHNRPHDISSDPHPEHTDCPAINDAGFLQPGQSRQTGNLNTVRTCGFHDHNEPSNTALLGRIIIQ